MRKLTLLLLLILSSTQLFAQKKFAVDKSSFIIGGSAGFSSTGGGGGDRLTRITVTPSLSFFVVQNLAIGGNGSFRRISVSEFSSTVVGIGPSIAYYFGGMNSKSYPFLSSSFLYGKQLDGPSRIDLRFSSGVAFMIAKNVAITGEAFFLLLINEADDDGNSFGIEIGISTFVF